MSKPRRGVLLVMPLVAVFWWWRAGWTGLVLGTSAAVTLLVLEWRFSLLTRLARVAAAGVGHVFAVLIQLVVLPGRRVEPPSGWVRGGAWSGPDRMLAGASPFPRRRMRLPFLFAVVLWVDLAAGVAVHAAFSPGDGVRAENRFSSSPVDDGSLTAVEDDAEGFTFVPATPAGGVPLWTLSTGSTDTLTFDDRTGRAGYVPAEPVLDVALIGASAAFSMGASDDESVASALARSLEAKGLPARVHTFAVPGFVAEQSVADLRVRLERGVRFDAVVLLTGFNDTFLAMYGPGGPLFMSDERFSAPEVPGAVSWWADRSLAAFLVGHRRTGTQPPMRRYTGAEHAFLQPEVGPAVEAASIRLESALAGLRALADAYGFVPVFAWTPSWIESPGEPEGSGGEVSETVRRRWQEVFSGVHERMSENARRVLGGEFLSPSPSVYGAGCFFDITHHLGRCSPLLAAPIAGVLSGRLAQVTDPAGPEAPAGGAG